MAEVLEIHPSEIIIEGRHRQEYGDLSPMVETIKKYGLIQPVTIDQNNKLLAGGRRYRACLEAGLDYIPCIRREVDGELDPLEIELIENVHRKDLEWQERAHLEKKIYDLKGSVRDAAQELGKSHGVVHRHIVLAEAMETIPMLANFKTENDAWKALKKIEEDLIVKELASRARASAKAVEESGDAPKGADQASYAAFQWADDHYHVGDCITGMKACEPGIFHFAEVDPPYGIDLTTLKRREGEGTGTEHALATYEEVPIDDYKDWLYDVASEVYRVLANLSFCVWWFGPTHVTLVREVLRNVGFNVNDIWGIWYKGAQGQTQQPDYNLANTYEPFYIARKGSANLAKPGRSNVFHYSPVPGQQKIHATERPIELMEEIIQTFTFPRQFFIVPFLGSGVTLRAGYRHEVTGVGWDKSEEHKNRFLLQVKEDAMIRKDNDDS